MEGLLENDVAVVTGAASGNGRAISKKFAEHGADVVVADIQEEPRREDIPTHTLINEETDAEAVFVECDVSSYADLEGAVGAAADLGGLDIMVNNAGIDWTRDFDAVTEEEYDKMMDINSKGVFFGSQLAAREMKERGEGSIINLSSLSGLQGSPGSVTYSASKGAVRLMTYSIAAQCGPDGIRANVIHPGYIETALHDDIGTDDDAREQYREMIPLRRLGEPEDIADVALFLASDLSSYVNATSIPVDGGWYNGA